MRKSELNILLVEDNPGDARLLREALKEIDATEFEMGHADTLTKALERLEQGTFDVGLLDLGLPDAQGLEVVRRIHCAAPDMPLLVLTALNDERLAIQSLREGAQDYLVKAEVDGGSVWRSLRYAMERHQVQLGLLDLSLVDDLTGLNNRRSFLNLASHHAKLASRTKKTFLVGFIDLDGLKHINDTFGHQQGNRALLETANVLRDSFRQSDILGRYGGDEFAVVVSDVAEGSEVTVTNRMHEKLRVRNAQLDARYALSLSVGIVASDPTQSPDLEQLLHEADALMYRQKRDRQLRSRGAISVGGVVRRSESDHHGLPEGGTDSFGGTLPDLGMTRRKDVLAQIHPVALEVRSLELSSRRTGVAKPARILIADDETAVRDLVDQVLRNAGYTTVRAFDGQDALEIAEKLGPFDLLLTDELMPRMRGCELVRHLRQRDPNLRVLYFSGYRGRLFDENVKLWECESFLDKPSTPEGLLEAVSLLLSIQVAPTDASA
jgi:diguanylate cyclase (GGDEF)-like protein